MKTIEEIKQTVSENRGYDSWDLLKEDYIYWDHDRLDKAIDDLATLYASQYKEKIKVLEEKVEIYKELLEKFVPIDRWDEASVILSTDGCGLAKDLCEREKQGVTNK